MKPRKDLLDLASLDAEEIEFILDNASRFKELFTRSVKKVPRLQGKTVLLLFYEPSTRTSMSFEIAAKRMDADVIALDVESSSTKKGESILDTVATMQAMKVDYIIVRHKQSGVPGIIAKNTRASVINAGDGFHAHPTQGLLDSFTLAEVWRSEFAGKKIVIAGDILHSRVARSTSTALRKLGAEVAVLGPGPLIPDDLPPQLRKLQSWEELLDWKPDAVNLLRIQHERSGGEQFFPSLGEYHKVYGLTEERLEVLRQRKTWVLHPGPINRGVELANAVTSYERCLINQQVENGIAARMAVLYWLRPAETERAD